MAFLQRKRTLRLSPGTCHPFRTQPGLCNPAAQPHAPKLSQRTPHGPGQPQHQGVPARPQEKRPGERGACPPRGPLRGSRGKRHRLSPSPPSRPTGERRSWAPLPAPAPSSRLPRGAAGRGRRQTPPAGHPRPRAPRRPSGPGRAVIGRIPTPRCRGRPRSALGPESRRPRRGNGGPGPGPGTHLAPRRPGKEGALARAVQIAAREGAGHAHPGEAGAGRRAGRASGTHGDGAAVTPGRTLTVLARGGAGRRMRSAGELSPARFLRQGAEEREGMAAVLGSVRIEPSPLP